MTKSCFHFLISKMGIIVLNSYSRAGEMRLSIKRHSCRKPESSKYSGNMSNFLIFTP